MGLAPDDEAEPPVLLEPLCELGAVETAPADGAPPVFTLLPEVTVGVPAAGALPVLALFAPEFEVLIVPVALPLAFPLLFAPLLFWLPEPPLLEVLTLAPPEFPAEALPPPPPLGADAGPLPMDELLTGGGLLLLVPELPLPDPTGTLPRAEPKPVLVEPV